MAFGDVLSSLTNRLRGSNLTMSSEKPLRKVSWRKLFGFEEDQANAARETAWLDGLRGVAAFLVMTYHFHLTWFSPFALEHPYGSEDIAMDLWRLPFLRLWMCSGHTQVSVFFVLSGFVLSWSSLASIRAGRYEKIAQGLGSAVFRRWLRLYLPCFAVAGWKFLTFWLGIIDIGGLMGSKDRSSNFFVGFWDYMKANEKFANPFDISRNQWSALHEYDATMWTIPYEYAGSLLVFCILIGTCRIRDYTRRTVITVGIALYAMASAQWSYWLFATGVCVADYVRQRGGFNAISESQSRRTTIIWTGVFIFALYIAGYPEPNDNVRAVGYEIFSALVPYNWKDVEGGGRFVWCWAGILVILSGTHLSGVRHVFDNRVARYLGRVSFMLYLTHRIVLELFGDAFKRVVLAAFGRDLYINVPPGDSLGHQLVTLCIYFIMIGVMAPLALFVAHWVSVFVDEPSVRFAKCIDELFTKPGNPLAAASEGPRRPAAGEESSHLLQPDTELLPTHNAPAASRYPA